MNQQNVIGGRSVIKDNEKNNLKTTFIAALVTQDSPPDYYYYTEFDGQR